MNRLIKFAQAVLGLAILALGITLLIAAEGPDPWGMLVLGLNRHLPLSLGITAQIGGLVLILLNWLWGKRLPGLATIMSMVLVGVFMDMFGTLTAFGEGIAMPQRLILLVTGIVTLALGISIYVRAGLGEGPVEGMMFVLSRKLGVSIGVAKVIQDLSFIIIGWLLGWTPQLGTLVSALGVGPVTQGFLRIMEKKKAPMAPK